MAAMGVHQWSCLPFLLRATETSSVFFTEDGSYSTPEGAAGEERTGSSRSGCRLVCLLFSQCCDRAPDKRHFKRGYIYFAYSSAFHSVREAWSARKSGSRGRGRSSRLHQIPSQETEIEQEMGPSYTASSDLQVRLFLKTLQPSCLRVFLL